MLPKPKRFYSLDVLRGIAALSVVLWHWQHFFLPLNTHGVAFSIDKQPLFDFLFIFYKFGFYAVQLFFCLSGFIFFWLYTKRIAEKTISLRIFSALRLSRLYPLHFATLIFVAIGQVVYKNITNTHFVYSLNDTYHFLLNLLFASSWGFEKGYSFNAPIWSVSIEVTMYAIFFLFCRIFNRNVLAVLCAILIGHFFVPKLNSLIASGIECFFLGGFSFLVYEKIISTKDKFKVSIWLPYLTFFAWLVTIVVINSNYDFIYIDSPWIVKKIVSVWPVFILFPMSIMSLVLLETKRGFLGRRLSFLGDISYSLYLLHFPLQLMAAIVVAKLAISQALYYSPWFMVLFYFVLVLTSLVSHYYFEIPVQNILRKKYISSTNKIAGK